MSRKFVKQDIKDMAWSSLQTTIEFVKVNGEYDAPALIDRVAREISHRFQTVTYTEIVDYLESKYNEDC